MRKEFQLTEEQLSKLLAAARPTPVMFLSGGQLMFGSPQENANRAWAELGRELGFKPFSVAPVTGKGQRYFTAEAAEIASPAPGTSEGEPADG